MIALLRLAPLPLLLAGLALCAAALLLVPWVIHAQAQEVTPTSGATGENPPGKPTNLQASAEHDAVTLTWTASSDQTVTHYAILRRNRDTDATGVFHVIESNAGPETSYEDTSVSAESEYNYRVKAVSPTGVSQWSGYVKADTPAAPDPTPVPTPTSAPTPEPESTPVDLAPSNLTAEAVDGGINLSWTAPAEDAGSVTGYEILRAVGEGDLATLADDTESTATTYTDATATEAGETYAYQVKAVRGEDRSQASGQAQVQLPHDPVDLAPSNLTAVLAEGGGVALSWTAPAKQADSVTGYEILRAVAQGELTTLAADTGSTATAYTDATATAAGETYAYQVKAIRGEDRSQGSGQAQVQVPHAPVDLAPSNLTAALADGGGVTLTWTAPAEDAGSVTGYEILRAVGEGDLATLAADTGSTATATEAGESYAYQVKAIRGEDRSQASGQAQVQVPHDPADLKPTGLTVSLVENKVALTWTAPAEDADSVTGYEILRRRPMEGETTLATLVADTESTATTYTDATANEAGVRYVYRVKALRGSEASLWSNFDRIELPADYVPDPTPTPEPESTPDDQAPTNLTAALAEGSGVALSWTAPAEDTGSVTGYEVLRAVGEGDMATLVDDTGSTATAYTDATATEAGETYAYQVKAIRGEDRSQASGQTQVQVPHDPVDLAPTGLTALILTSSVVGEEDSTKVGLTWTAPAEDADSVTGYEVLRAVGEGELATLVDDTGATATAYTDATATEAGETYVYQVKAIRGEDRSQASGQAQVQLPHDAVDLAPSNLTAEKVDGGINLSWTAPAEDADSVTGYEILRAVGEGELASLAADTGSTATAYTDATATDAEETYAYQVKAVRGQARSQGSNKVIEAPEPPATAENLAPSNLAFDILEDGVELTWDAPAADADSVTGYRVVRRRPNLGENEWLVWKRDTGSTETTYRDGYAQTHGGYYMYRVRALRGDEYSKMSNRVDVRRPQAAPETTAWAPSNLEALVYAEVTLGEEGVTTQVKLTWDVPAEGTEWVRGYEVQRATCDGDFTTLVADTGSTATAYTDASTEAGETYTYRVRARRPQGLSLTSNTWTVIFPGGDGTGVCGIDASVDPNLFNPELYAPQMVVETDEDTVLVKNTGQTLATALALSNTFSRRAQGFTTGAYTGGYTLSSIGISFNAIADTSTAGSQLTVTLNGVAGNGNPGDALCTLSDPGSFTASAVNTFDAPTTCPTLSPSTTYFAVIERAGATSISIAIASTDSSSEDAGGATGWSIGDDLHYRQSGQSSWNKTTGESYQIEVSATLGQEFNTLDAAGNDNPMGIWSDGTTMWVVQRPSSFVGHSPIPKLFAYNMATKQRDSAKDFNTLDAAGNDNPTGLWSDGSTMWVVDHSDEKVYAYDMDTKARFPSEDFNNLYRINIDGEADEQDAKPFGILSDGDIMWVLDNDGDDLSIYAYDMDTKAHVPNEDFRSLAAAGNEFPGGIWADETIMFVANSFAPNRIFAYWRSNKAPVAARHISLSAQNNRARGIWSDGSTMWVSDSGDAKLYAYTLPDPVLPEDTLSMERVTDTMAVVKVDIQALLRQFGSAEPAVSVKVLGTRSGATMHVHPSASYARFLLLGLSPETQYTVVASYGVTTRYDLGDAGREVFRTDYARLAGIKTSGLTHTEATVTVSLAGADVDGRCCFRWYPHSNEGEAEPGYTYYLRHKASDGAVWSGPVALTFSDFTADVKLTGLDPGAAYDVEVAETADFMPPQGSAGSYDGTLTVDNDNGLSGIGFDQLGFGGFGDPYGSLSPTTFKLGGVDHSIVELRVGVQSFLAPGQAGKLFLTFDKALPDDAAFTLTLGTTEFNSSDATVSGQTYSWPGGPSWSNNDEVAVELDLTMVAFREGTTLEEVGAFTTPTMPPTLAFEAEMTVGTGTSFDGYDSSQGSLSPGTFDVGGVQYTVDTLGFDTDDNEFELTVTPALPFDSFTLTLGATELSVGSTDYGSGVVLVKNTGQTPISTAAILTSASNQYAQQFTTGTNAGGYALGSIGFQFGTFADISTAGSHLTVTLNADNNGNPGAALCTLSDPTSFTSAAVNTFDAPATGTEQCPKLAASTTYFAVIKQVSFSDAINFGITPSDDEDSGGAPGWLIGNDSHVFSTTSNIWSTTGTLGSIRVEVNGGGALPAPNVSVKSGSGTYTWSGRTNPNWASGATVDVKLDVSLIDICGRTPTVADAIVAATLSYDFCHMTAPIDLAGVTELDLRGMSGYGLKAGDFAGLSGLEILDISGYSLSGHSWNQLPVGLFDGLDSLEVLDLSDTNLLNLNRRIFGGLSTLVELDLSDTLLDSTAVPVGVFDGLDSLEILRIANAGYLGRGINFVDEDIFRGLNTLRELDVRPIRPHDDVLAPLTSLETLNGQDYTP